MLTPLAKDEITSHFNGLSNPQLITATLDREHPKFSNDPRAALCYVRDNRSLSRFMRELREARALASGRYVWVLEFQRAGWPHWHFAVDAKPTSHADPSPYVHFAVVRGAWQLGHTYVGGKSGHLPTPESKLRYLLKGDKAPDWAKESRLQLRWFDHDRQKHCDDSTALQSLPMSLPKETYVESQAHLPCENNKSEQATVESGPASSSA